MNFQMNFHQVFGVILVTAGFAATLCGCGVISRPKNVSDRSVIHYRWMGPLGILIGLLEIFGTRSA